LAAGFCRAIKQQLMACLGLRQKAHVTLPLHHCFHLAFSIVKTLGPIDCAGFMPMTGSRSTVVKP
jgi:hypothetical protein